LWAWRRERDRLTRGAAAELRFAHLAGCLGLEDLADRHHARAQSLFMKFRATAAAIAKTPL
jgi:hypothetical protein